MRSFFRFLLRALILLVVALVSALTAMRLAIHGSELAVPNLVDKTPVEARRITDSGGFAMEVERQYYSADVAEGKIISQLPPAGTLVRRGWEIRVAQSLGPQRVQIPSVLGESERAAEINIQRRGLEVNAVDRITSPALPPGQVLAQSPPPNASGIAAPKLSLLVSDPAPPQAFVMPSFVGQRLASVQLILQNAGLHPGDVTQAGVPTPVAAPSTTPPGLPPPAPPQPTANGVIASQIPAPGEKVLAGASINFEVH